jgi:anaerobic selenocysteine-containing dehydrogenase
MTDNQDKRIESTKALAFLKDHPAIDPTESESGLPFWFFMSEVCKREYTEQAKRGVSVYRDGKFFERYKDRFDEEYKDEEPSSFDSIEVPYEELFGEPWKFDHVEYWYEVSFLVYDGDPYSENIGDHYDVKNYQRYAGPRGGADSFEDMLIKCANECKEYLGDFNTFDNFHTPEEKENREKESAFLFEDVDDPKFKDCKEMKSNPKSVNVWGGLINRRWLAWFKDTPQAKKDWDWEIEKWDKMVSDLNNIPEERKNLLGVK